MANEQRAIDVLYEGLITSYPLPVIIQDLHHKLKCKTQRLRKDKSSFYNCFSISGHTKDVDFSQLLSILNLGGWFIALASLYTGKTLIKELRKNISLTDLQDDKATSFEMKIEAKFDTQLSKEYWPEKLYCLAPSIVKKKIEKVGLVPKAGKNLDNQPDRIYLGFDKDKLVREMLPQLRVNDRRYKEGCILTTIDASKLPSKVRLFDDINWPGDAVYTIVNIPPYCISEIEDIT